MQYTKLGATGLTVSRVALGCVGYGDKEGQWPNRWARGEDDAYAHLKRALELGINYFDTADKYSLGQSEEIVGRCLRKLAQREDVVVCTKVFHPMTSGPNGGGLSRKHILAACDASLKRLQMDYIDVYVIHHWDFCTPIEETLEALDSLVRAGKVRYVGASSLTAWQLAKAYYVARLNGWHQFVSHSCHYNLLYREDEHEMIPFCIDQGIGVTAWSPQAKGALAEAAWNGEVTVRRANDPWTRAYAPAVAKAVFEEVMGVASAHGVGSSQIALAWVLNAAGIDSAIVGASTISQIEQAVGAVAITLTPEEVAAVEARYVRRDVQGHDEPTPAQTLALKAQRSLRTSLDWIEASKLGPDQCY